MPPLAVVQFAKARADVALDAAVGEPVPVTRREMGTFEILFHDPKKLLRRRSLHDRELPLCYNLGSILLGPALPAIRPTAVAGSFYSADAAELRAEIDDLLGSTVSAAIAPIPKALIAPHAGYIYFGPIAAAGYRRLAPARERIMRVVLFGPSHFVAFHGLAAASADGWQTPLAACRSTALWSCA